MKKFLSNFFIPKDGKISDKSFMYNITAMIVGIVVCMASLTAATWAWFCIGVTNNGNNIKASECLLTVAADEGGNIVDPLALDEFDRPIPLGEGRYTVVLTLPRDSASGYCILDLGGKDNEVYTAAIISHEQSDPETLGFTLVIEEGARVTFSAHWGVPSPHSGKTIVGSGDVITIHADGSHTLEVN